MRDGIVLGVSVGLGFAAFESAGYAFNALFTSNGLSLLDVVETEVLRGILTPIGHGVWTGILGGTLFAAAARYGKLRVTRALLGWNLVVAVLHSLWDSSRGIAVALTLLTNTPLQWLTIESGRAPTITAAQVHIFTIFTWAFMALVGVLGLFSSGAAGAVQLRSINDNPSPAAWTALMRVRRGRLLLKLGCPPAPDLRR
jgi:hypothetical protein